MTGRILVVIFMLAVLFVSCDSSKKKSIIDDDSDNVADIDENEDASEVSDDVDVSETCGNEKVDEGEVCDGNLVNCTDINDRLYSGGKAWCREDCLGFDTVTCEEVFHECGNSIIEGPEECDGGVIDCVDIDPYRFSGGKATCEEDCSGWDTVTCDEREPVCGDEVVELDEVCDSNTKRCAEIDEKYYLGTAYCNDECDGWVLDDCVEGVAECGNGIVEGLEECDDSIDECTAIDPTKYSGGKAYCLGDCSGWDTITCTEKSASIDWEEGSSHTGSFEPRASHCGAYFNGKFWIIGGSNNEGTFADIWSSADGAVWIKEEDSAHFGAIQRHKCPVYDNKLWVIGGRDGSGVNNPEVWYSTDGKNWNKDNVGEDDFLPGSNFETLVKDSSLFVFSVASDFASESKGIWERNIHGWNKISETVPYGNDSSFAGGVINGTFFLMGGIDSSFQTVRDTIWYSDDGLDWESSQGDFFPRAFHAAVAIDDSLYMIGGNTLMTRTNDVLKSNDGLNWGIVTSNAGFSGRSSHAVVTSELKLCVIGGTLEDGTYTSDVWCTGI